MTTEKACPACDVARMQCSPLTAMALGVALGSAHSDMHAVTELMCETHRGSYVMAMARAAMIANEDGEVCPV